MNFCWLISIIILSVYNPWKEVANTVFKASCSVVWQISIYWAESHSYSILYCESWIFNSNKKARTNFILKVLAWGKLLSGRYYSVMMYFFQKLNIEVLMIITEHDDLSTALGPLLSQWISCNHQRSPIQVYFSSAYWIKWITKVKYLCLEDTGVKKLLSLP